MACGLTLIFGVMNIVNVAHGATADRGRLHHLVGLVASPGIDPSCCRDRPDAGDVRGGVAALQGRGLADQRRARVSMSVLLTFGIAHHDRGRPQRARRATSSGPRPRRTSTQSFRVGDLAVPKAQVYGASLAVVILGLLYLVLTRTWTGTAIRATAQNASGAALVGIQRRGDLGADLRDRHGHHGRRRLDPLRALPVLPGLALRLDLPAARASSCSAAWAACAGALVGALLLGPGGDADRDVRIAAVVDR